MSSRVLRKLQKDSDFVEDPDAELSDEIEYNKFNRFDLLNQQQGSLSESEFKEDDNETENLSTATSSEKIKKKRKKKRKTKPHLTRSSEDNADIEEDEIIKTVKLVDKMLGHHSDHRTATPDLDLQASPVKNLLTIQHKNLNPQYEMKRIFGSKVIHAEQKRNRNQRGSLRPLKSVWLVNPKENWPAVNKTGIYMNLVQPLEDSSATTSSSAKKLGTDKNVIYFAFEHSSTYRQIQQKFLTAVESMNSDNIIQIVNQQPYHVDSLIQLSELCKMSEDHSMAADLIEHAIFALESSFHSMFNLTQGNCRLEYRRQENRCFFIVLFKHAQYLEARACSRTALEIVKLILTLDNTDPLACLLIIDYYAIRSKQYEFLIQLYNEWESTHNFSQLPNMAYSFALALFYSKKIEAADEAIQYALLMFPGVLKPLLESLSIQADSRVNSHKYFGPNSFNSQPLALQQLTSLYVCRSKNVWCDSDLLPWLERNVNVVLDKVDSKDEIVSEYTTKRNQRYVNPPRTILRHIILSDFKEKVPIAYFLKKETEPILMYDPLPPLDSVNTYTKPKVTAAARTIPGSAFSIFFQSLLPSFNMQEPAVVAPAPPRQAEEPEEDGARGGVALIPLPENDGAGGVDPGAELRNSLNSIVEAMRNFLSDIRSDRPNAGDLDENDSSDDDPNNYLT